MAVVGVGDVGGEGVVSSSNDGTIVGSGDGMVGVVRVDSAACSTGSGEVVLLVNTDIAGNDSEGSSAAKVGWTSLTAPKFMTIRRASRLVHFTFLDIALTQNATSLQDIGNC
jgi:hypothetical protein